ncbi:hypothetical protein SAMN04490183_4002 [Pseudomonas corrugata]|nr:hypothetical protein SAMN04490183_4002 [Pseudomonas corrugata]
MTTTQLVTSIGALVFGCIAIRLAGASGPPCEQAWRDNPISSSCKATVSAMDAGRPPRAMSEPQGNGRCRITVTCRNAYGGGTPNEIEDASVDDVKHFHVCNGVLQSQSCGDLFRP